MAFIKIAYAKEPPKPGVATLTSGKHIGNKKDKKTPSPIKGHPLAAGVFKKSMKTQMPGGTAGVIPTADRKPGQVGLATMEQRPTPKMTKPKFGTQPPASKKSSVGGKRFASSSATKPKPKARQAGEYGNSSPQPQIRML